MNTISAMTTVEAQVTGSLSVSVAQAERVSAPNTAGLAYLTGISEGTSTVKVNSFLKVRRIA